MSPLHVEAGRPSGADGAACEHLIREAFWNVYHPGCHEHYLWHLAMLGHPDLIEELTLVAKVDGEVVGCVMSTRGRVISPEAGPHAGPGTDTGLTVVVPGPLAVAPGHQRGGIGARLMEETIARAADAGFPAAFLYGNPDYYPRFGFRDAAHWGVTTGDGQNFPAFMARELCPGGLAGVRGRLVESGLFEVDEAAVEEFDAGFPPKRKERTATQL